MGPGSERWRACRSRRGRRTRRRSSGAHVSSPSCPLPCARRPPVTPGWRWSRASRASARPNSPAPSPGRPAKDGALVLWGSAWEDGGAPPYWPWVQVLRSYARQAGPEALAAAAGPQAAVLGPAPARARPRPSAARTGSGDAARLTLFEAVGAVLDRASRAAPLAVVLDDLHAAGRPSALLLRFAAAARLSRVLLLATYRTAEAALDPDVSDVIAALESASPPLVLAGLSAGDIRLMLPGADADVLAVGAAPQRGQPAVRIPGGAPARPRRGHGRGGAGPGRHPAGRPPPGRQARPDAKAATGDGTPGRGRNPGHRRGARPRHRPGPGRGGAGQPRPDRWPGCATTPPPSACSARARMSARSTGSGTR